MQVYAVTDIGMIILTHSNNNQHVRIHIENVYNNNPTINIIHTVIKTYPCTILRTTCTCTCTCTYTCTVSAIFP